MKNLMLREYSSIFLLSLFVVVPSVLWMTNIMSLSPVYLCIIPIVFFPLYYKYEIKYNSYYTYLIYLFLFFFSIYLIVQPIFSESTIKNNFVLAFSFLFYIFCDSILYSLKTTLFFEKIIVTLSLITSLYLIIDFYIRFTSADFVNIPNWIQVNPIFRFYLLKGYGIYGDSNSTASIGLVIYSLCYFYSKCINRKNRIIKYNMFFLFISIVLTCSRAAIIAIVVNTLFYHLFYIKSLYIKIFDFIIFTIFAIGLLYFLSIDPSGKTKIDIYIRTGEYFIKETDPIKFLFGYGGNNSSIILGRYAHNPLSVYLIEYGFIGFCLYIFVFLILFLDVGLFSLFVLIPYFLLSLSYSPLHTTYLFASLSLIKHSKRIFHIKWGRLNA